METTNLQPPAKWPPLRVGWYAVAVLFIAYTFSFADRYILSLLIGPIKEDLGLSDTRISLLHGFAFALFYTFMGIPIGRLADRYSRRTIIAIGIAVWSAMTAACGLARGFWELFAARVGVGVGEAALSPAAYSMIADLFPPRLLGRALSVYSAGAIVGGGMAFIVGGMVIQAIVQAPTMTLPLIGTVKSWQLAFIVVGLPGLLVSALMYTLPEPLRRSKALPGSVADQDLPLSQVFRFLGSHWRVYLPLFLGFSMLAVLFNGVLAWTPAFLSRTYGLAIGQSGLYIGVLLLTFGAGGMLAGGVLADRLLDRGYRDATIRTGIVAGLGCLPFVTLAPLMPNTSAALALMAPLWFFATSGFGAGVAALQYITPNRMRGVASALYLFSGNLLAVGIGPTVIALVTDYGFGDEAALRYSIIVVGATCAVLAVVALGLALRPFRELVASRGD
jgi:MFS family permease